MPIASTAMYGPIFGDLAIARIISIFAGYRPRYTDSEEKGLFTVHKFLPPGSSATLPLPKNRVVSPWSLALIGHDSEHRV